MRIAFVHDWLNGMRGGERCLEALCELYPDADLYSLFYEKGKLSQTIESLNIHTSFIQKLPFAFKKYRHYPRFIGCYLLNFLNLCLPDSTTQKYLFNSASV